MATKITSSSADSASPRRIIISGEEYTTGVTSLDTVQSGIEEFHTHGFVILENAIASDSIKKLRTQMLEDATTCLEFPDLVFNHGNQKNNFSITPPLSNEFLFDDVWANKHAVAIMQHIIGPKPLLCWASSNVLIKSGEHARQAVHSDAYADIPSFPFCVEMNIYLQDTNPGNGSTEIWPGTHIYTEHDHLSHGRGWIKKKAFTARARKSPPIQPTIPAGSILMRDLRMWHSGMPSTSSTPRIIVALLYFPQWFRPQMRLTFPISVRQKVEAWENIDLLTNTDFVEGSVDHLRTHFPINFTQDSTKGLIEYRIAVDKLQGREPGAHIPVTKDNYWTPSKPRTRAAIKRALEDGEDNGGKGKKTQTQKTIQKPLIKRESQAERDSKELFQQDAELQGKVNVESFDEQSNMVNLQNSDVMPTTTLKTNQDGSRYLKVKQGSEQDKNILDDLPDYEDSPKGLTPWTPWPQEQIFFYPGYALSQEPGPQISPQFSPKSKLGPPHKMKAAQEELLEKHAHLNELVEKELQNRQQQQYGPIVPEAKMLPDPQ